MHMHSVVCYFSLKLSAAYEQINTIMSCVIIWAHFLIVGLGVALLPFVFPYSLYHWYTCLANLVFYTILASSTISISKCLFCRERIRPDNKAVLITGCASGFGNDLAKRLDAKGFQVFASCRSPVGEGVDDLKRNCSDRLKVFCLDVSKDESVEKAVDFVKENLGSNVLWAVVNNAGTTGDVYGPFDMIPTDIYAKVFNVNALGAVRVTKAFLPLLKECKGRIVNMSSVLGRKPVDHVSHYIMSKYAVVAFTECLYLEMKEWGIHVISIEPELFRSKIVDPRKLSNPGQSELTNVYKDISSSYGEAYMKKFRNTTITLFNMACSSSRNVIDDMETAITVKNPCQVYMPCRNTPVRVFFSIMIFLPLEIYERVTTIIKIALAHFSPRYTRDYNLN